jgi:hypothetical protein
LMVSSLVWVFTGPGPADGAHTEAGSGLPGPIVSRLSGGSCGPVPMANVQGGLEAGPAADGFGQPQHVPLDGALAAPQAAGDGLIARPTASPRSPVWWRCAAPAAARPAGCSRRGRGGARYPRRSRTARTAHPAAHPSARSAARRRATAPAQWHQLPPAGRRPAHALGTTRPARTAHPGPGPPRVQEHPRDPAPSGQRTKTW